jgi:hypothetical protein
VLGFDVVELPIEEPGQFEVARVLELAERNGLAVCAVIGTGRDLLLDGEREAGIAYLQACIDTGVAGPFYSAVPTRSRRSRVPPPSGGRLPGTASGSAASPAAASPGRRRRTASSVRGKDSQDWLTWPAQCGRKHSGNQATRT